MKILQDLQEYIRYAIDTQNIELECIYGSSQHKKVDKETFVRILNYCNEQFKIIGVNYNTTSYNIPINKKLETTITRDFYHLSKKNWSFKKYKYSIKNIN